MGFDYAEATYRRLRDSLESGDLDQTSFEAAIEELTVQDEQGRYWALGADSGQWYVWEDGVWQQTEPPRAPERPDDTCPRCGQPVEAGDAFCDRCGQPLTAPGSGAAAQPGRTATAPRVQQSPESPTIQSPAPPQPSWQGYDTEEPGAASPAPVTPAKGRPSVPVAVFIAGGLVLCLLVAAGGGLVFLRSRSGGSFLPQALPPTTSPNPGRSEASPTPQAIAATDTPSSGGLEALTGVWEYNYGGYDEQYTITQDPDGRLRLRPLFLCEVIGEDDWRLYLELEAVGEGEWDGFLVEDPHDWEDEEDVDSASIQVTLSHGGSTLNFRYPEGDDSLTWQRADSDETVVLEIVNAASDTIWELRMAASGDPDRLDGEQDRLASLLFSGDSCEMTLPPGTYDVSALYESDEVAGSTEGMEIRRDWTWVITGGG